MQLARVRFGGAVYLAKAEADDTVELLIREGPDPFADVLRDTLAKGLDLERAGSRTISLNDCKVLAPVRFPSKFLAVGLNYLDHAAESEMETPKVPLVFSKASSSICGPDDPVSFPTTDVEEVDYEAELAFVVGRRCKGLTEREAEDAIFGYTACNDISSRRAQFSDGQWFRGKSFDSFAPLGPWVVTDLGGAPDLGIRCLVNGEVMQDDRTSNMIFSPATILAYLSQFMTLWPGDIIATGTPPGVGFARVPPVFLRPGDNVAVEIEDIGRLRSSIDGGNS